MRLPWIHRPLSESKPPEKGDARQKYAEARARRPEVDAIAERLRHLRERNHFGEAIEATFARRRQS